MESPEILETQEFPCSCITIILMGTKQTKGMQGPIMAEETKKAKETKGTKGTQE